MIRLVELDSTMPANQALLLPAAQTNVTLFLKQNPSQPPALYAAKNVAGSYVEVPLENASVMYGNYGESVIYNSVTNTFTLGPVTNFMTPPTLLGPADKGLMLSVKLSKPGTRNTTNQSVKVQWGAAVYNLVYGSNNTPVYDVSGGEVVTLLWDGSSFQTYSSIPNPAINTTYSVISNLATLSRLIPGAYYWIADFVTYFLDDTGTPIPSAYPEPLLLIATSTSTFAEQAFSSTKPGDEIKYRITPPSWAPAAPGEIYYRKDTVQNVACNYDFRHVLFPRWNTSGMSKTAWDLTDVSAGYNLATPQNMVVIPASFYINVPGGGAGNEFALPLSPGVALFPTFQLDINLDIPATTKDVEIIADDAFLDTFPPGPIGYFTRYGGNVFFSSVVIDVKFRGAANTFSGTTVNFHCNSMYYNYIDTGIDVNCQRINNCVLIGPQRVYTNSLINCASDNGFAYVNMDGSEFYGQRFILQDVAVPQQQYNGDNHFIQHYCIDPAQVSADRGKFAANNIYIRSDYTYVDTWYVWSDTANVYDKRMVQFVEFLGYSNFLVNNKKVRFIAKRDPAAVPIRWTCIAQQTNVGFGHLLIDTLIKVTKPTGFDYIEFMVEQASTAPYNLCLKETNFRSFEILPV